MTTLMKPTEEEITSVRQLIIQMLSYGGRTNPELHEELVSSGHEVTLRTVERMVDRLEDDNVVRTRLIRHIAPQTKLVELMPFFTELPAFRVLQEKIRLGESHVDEYDPSEIFYAVPSEEKSRLTETKAGENILSGLNKASRRVLLWLGDASSFADPKTGCLEKLEEVVLRRHNPISITAICRVDERDVENYKPILALKERSEQQGRGGRMDFRHLPQPLRGQLIDEDRAQLVRVTSKGAVRKVWIEPTVRDREEFEFTVFQIWNKQWVSTLEKIFWFYYAQGQPIEDRMRVLQKS